MFPLTLLRAVRGLFVRPSLVATALHAPVVLVPGRAPVRVVATGTGFLRIGRTRIFVADGFDDLVFVDVDGGVTALQARFRGRRVALPLVPVAAPAPVPVDVVAPVVPVAVVDVPDVAVAVPTFAIPLPDLVEETR
jgi:hypothetical protein